MSLKILNVWQHYPCQMYLLCTVDLLCLAKLFARQNQVIWNVKSPLLDMQTLEMKRLSARVHLP